MRDKREHRCLLAYILLALGVLGLFILNVCIGSVGIPLSEIAGALTGDRKSVV